MMAASFEKFHRLKTSDLSIILKCILVSMLVSISSAYPGTAQATEVNAKQNDLKLTTDPSSTSTFSSYNKEMTKVKTECLNPTKTMIDECIESTNVTVMEKCMPGLINILNQDVEAVSKGPFVLETKQSEICLRHVLGHCSFDSRYQINTRIKRIMGINLEITFEDEFEMDCCDSQTMKEVIQNVQDCFDTEKKSQEKLDIDQSKKNISTEILNKTGSCIEDHTSYSCVLKNETLFREVLRKIIGLVNKQSLWYLEKLGAKDHSFSRLCLKFIDYGNLEHCEPGFFDYVHFLKDKKPNPDLFRKLHKCFQDSLKVCPSDTADLLVQILSGAVEGNSGKEPDGTPTEEPETADGEGSVMLPFMEEMTSPTTVVDNLCSNKTIDEWKTNTIKCFLDIKHGKVKKTFKGWKTLRMCSQKIKLWDCKFHTYGHFKNIFSKFFDIMKETEMVPENGEQDEKCLEQLKSKKLRNCTSKFFFYFIARSHSHHTKESLQSQLEKVRFCFQIQLKSCRWVVIDNLLHTYGSIFKMHLPELEPAKIVTQVTVPEGLIWCETKIISTENPLPSTQIVTKLRNEVTIHEKRTPTTVVPDEITVPGIYVRRTFLAPWTEIIRHSPIGLIFFKYQLPTTSMEENFPLAKRTEILTLPQQTTTIIYKNITQAPIIATMKPTTTVKDVYTPSASRFSYVWPCIHTTLEIFSPKRKEYLETFTPSTIQTYARTPPTTIYSTMKRTGRTQIFYFTIQPKPYPEKITPTSTMMTKIIPKTSSESEEMGIITEILVFTQKPHVDKDKRTPTTIQQHIFKVTPHVKIITVPSEKTTVRESFHVARTYKEELTPSTVSTMVLPVSKTYMVLCLNASTVKAKFIERTIGVKTEENRSFTTETKWIPLKAGKEYNEVITPSTTIKEIVKPKKIFINREVDTPSVKIFTITPKTSEREEFKTPTTQLTREITLPERTINATLPPPTTEIQTFSPTTKEREEQLTPTTASNLKRTVKPTCHNESLHGSTMKIRVFEIFGKSQSNFMPPATTETEFHTPKVVPSVSEIFHTILTIKNVVVPSTIESKVTPKEVNTRTWKEMLSSRTFAETVEPSTVRTKSHSVKQEYVTISLTPPKTAVQTIPPEVSTREEMFTQSTVRTIRMPVQCNNTIEELKGTTILVKILEITGKTKAQSSELPGTKIEIRTQSERETWQNITPSTTEREIMTVPTKFNQHQETNAMMIMQTMKPKGIIKEEIKTPTTHKFITIPLTRSGRAFMQTPKTTMYTLLPNVSIREEYLTPSTTRTQTFTPEMRTLTEDRTITTKKEVFTPSPSTFSHKEPVITSVVHYTPTPKGYKCVYPTTIRTPIIQCGKVKRKQDCTPQFMAEWTKKLRNCVTAELKKMEKKMEDWLDSSSSPPFEDFEKVAIKCVKKIKDTPCRRKTFNLAKWVQETIIISVIQKKEKSALRLSDESIPLEVQECFLTVKESNMNQCFPGMYGLLYDILIARKPIFRIEVEKSQDTDCLPDNFKQCEDHALKFLEKMLNNTLGVCIRLTTSNDSSTCNGKDELVLAPKPCQFKEFLQFGQLMETCVDIIVKQVKKIGNKLSAENLLSATLECAKSNGPSRCPLTKWKIFEHAIQSAVTYIQKNADVDQEHLQKLSSDDLKRCLQDLVSLAPTLNDVEDKKKSIALVANCIRTVLKDFPAQVTSDLIELLLILTGVGAFPLPKFRMSTSTISSIKITSSDLEICEHKFGTTPMQESSRPDFVDECVPICEEKDGKGSLYLLMKSCTLDQVQSWVNTVKECVHKNSTTLGLKNVDFLNMTSILKIIKTCVKQSPIGCRPKYLEDFKDIIKNILRMLRRNSLSSKHPECRNHLRIKNLGKCVNILHRSLVLLNDQRRQKSGEERVTKCLQHFVQGCPQETIQSLMDTLNLAMVINPKNIHTYGLKAFTTCQPESFNEKTTTTTTISQDELHCGPGGILVREDDGDQQTTVAV